MKDLKPFSECGNSTCFPSSFLPLNEASNVKDLAGEKGSGTPSALFFATEGDSEIVELLKSLPPCTLCKFNARYFSSRRSKDRKEGSDTAPQSLPKYIIGEGRCFEVDIDSVSADMNLAVEHLRAEFSRLRVGRASSGMYLVRSLIASTRGECQVMRLMVRMSNVVTKELREKMAKGLSEQAEIAKRIVRDIRTTALNSTTSAIKDLDLKRRVEMSTQKVYSSIMKKIEDQVALADILKKQIADARPECRLFIADDSAPINETDGQVKATPGLGGVSDLNGQIKATSGPSSTNEFDGPIKAESGPSHTDNTLKVKHEEKEPSESTLRPLVAPSAPDASNTSNTSRKVAVEKVDWKSPLQACCRELQNDITSNTLKNSDALKNTDSLKITARSTGPTWDAIFESFNIEADASITVQQVHRDICILCLDQIFSSSSKADALVVKEAWAKFEAAICISLPWYRPALFIRASCANSQQHWLLSRMISVTTATSSESERRQAVLDAKKCQDLNRQMRSLKLEIMDKDQRIASLNRELQDRDRLISALKRKQELHPKPTVNTVNAVRAARAANTLSTLNTIKAVSRPIVRTVPMHHTSTAAVKKPVPPFISYCAHHRNELKARNPNISATDVTRILSQQWRALSATQQQKYAGAN
ncbi:hypothetical protein PSACC_03689 [Paramicrosporidium saccamoebae]|uniref:HMG box domain-containing protein n=1 Tax=Paramicrosporidium saccamoebae TaxID=1246581 RepID=A0A2H9TFY7_9FUNG|nr:hypothetical protein PSACC_03689 [Paramicrosporidium saccamoebae]